MAAAGIEASARGTDPRMPRRPGSIESVPPSSRPARSLARGDRGAPLSAPRRPSRNRDELPLLRGPARRQETSNPLQPCELRPASPAGGRAGPRRRADPGCPNRSAAPTAGAPGTVTPPPRLGLASRAEHPPKRHLPREPRPRAIAGNRFRGRHTEAGQFTAGRCHSPSTTSRTIPGQIES
jgi:hypothetical protein